MPVLSDFSDKRSGGVQQVQLDPFRHRLWVEGSNVARSRPTDDEDVGVPTRRIGEFVQTDAAGVAMRAQPVDTDQALLFTRARIGALFSLTIITRSPGRISWTLRMSVRTTANSP